MARRVFALPLALVLAGCSSSQSGSPGGGGNDAATGGDGSAPFDATMADSGAPDTATTDTAMADGGTGTDAPLDTSPAGPCPAGMVLVTTYCIDRWESYVAEFDDAGAEQPHSPFDVVDGLNVVAKTASGVVPQGYISQVQATQACANAGKRLCSAAEFQQACEGPD